MNNSFYRAFEDRYRGSREMIKARQVVYLPFLEPLKQIYSECPTLDLGCGRGEWLELMMENGFAPRGVDLDKGMLEACQQRGLPAEEGDALVALAALADDSCTVISGFHIAEHIPFEAVQRLVNEALRALKPGGLLILETPNPENLVVAGSSFYLDPTHEKPLPHQLLGFLAEFSGFARTKLLRLQEADDLAQMPEVDLLSVLGGASPDYAIVAQKQAEPEQLALFNEAFEKDYGVSLDVLAWKYDAGVDRKIDQVLRETIDTQLQRAEDRLVRLERERDYALAREQAVLNSMSWRITAPVRAVRTTVGKAARLCIRTAKASLRLGVSGPRERLIRLARRMPWLRTRLRRLRYLDHKLRSSLGIGGAVASATGKSLEAASADRDVSPVWRKHGHNDQLKSPLESWFNQ